MNEVIVDNVEINHKNRVPSAFIAILSTLATIFIAGFSFYLSKTWWFIPLGIVFAISSIFLIAPLFIKDDYKAMGLQGAMQIIYVLLFMPYLLFMILWNDPNGLMDYSFITYVILGSAALLFVLFFFICRLTMIKHYHPLMHAYGNYCLITAFYLIIIIELTVMNQFFPGQTTKIFENLLREKPIWTYIISIILNAGLTVLAALLALSTAIKAKTKEELTTGGKIKHTIKWINDNEVSMFIGLIFTLYLAVLSFINIRQNVFYILLFVYYLGTASIRFLNYLWHKRIEKVCGDNQIKDNRLSSWILLFDALTYLAFSNILAAGAIVMMIEKGKAGSNIYLFLFMIIPMAIYRLINTGKSIRKNRRGNNTYKLGVSLIGLICVFFSILEVVAISFHQIPIDWIRVVFIILAIIAAKIAVIVVSIIFVVHWFRSIILNRRGKERKYLKEKNKNAAELW